MNWLELVWQYIAMTRNNLCIISISLAQPIINSICLMAGKLLLMLDLANIKQIAELTASWLCLLLLTVFRPNTSYNYNMDQAFKILQKFSKNFKKIVLQQNLFRPIVSFLHLSMPHFLWDNKLSEGIFVLFQWGK